MKRSFEVLEKLITTTWFYSSRRGKTSSLVDAEGVIKLTPEEEALLLKIRAEMLAAEKGKAKDDQAEKEKKLSYRRKYCVKHCKLMSQRATKSGKKRRGYDEEDESDSDSHPRRKQTNQHFSSDSDEELDGSQIRLTRLEKAMFGDRRVD
ncbi:hypothetical protein AgCh_017993 [Apium graveolens]